ncbi:flagellinolysin [Cellvibrio sp.]
MTISKIDYFDIASLAEASYATLREGGDVNKAALIRSGFSDSQAEDILSRWSVKAHLPNTSTGFSMSLFEGADGIVLAFRGTEPDKQWANDIRADVGDIVSDGVAIDQIIDLVNFWAWVKSDDVYTAAKLEVLDNESRALRTVMTIGDKASQIIFLALMGLRDDVVVDFPTFTVKRVVWENSDTAFDDPRYQRGLGLGDDIAAKGLTVTGHSLGGHLASAFTRLFPDANASALTINGAGFGILGLTGFADKNVSNLFEMLFGNPSFGGSTILNLYGEKGLELVTQDALLSQPGGHLPVFIEQTNLANTLGHGTGQMTDSLAVYDLFFRMDKTLPLDKLLRVFNRASNSTESSLERMVIFLADLFKVDVSLATDDRESLHKSINAIRESSYFINVADQIKVVPHANAGLAKSDFNHFLSLYFSLPFVLQGADSTLLGLHGEIYSFWTADQSLSAEDRKNGKANFSDEWYQDRANYLALLLERNAKDIAFDESADPSGKDIFYVNVDGFDSGSGRIFSGGVDASSINQEPAPPRVVFGTNESNTPANTGSDGFVGGNGNDRIYGLGGDDKLNGLKGHDVLDGGAGVDELTGGEGADVLKGGQGKDVYVFDGNFGRDIVIDSDGSGTIVIDGITLSSVKQTVKDGIAHRDSTNTVEVIKFDEGGSTSLLVTSLTNRDNSIHIKNWKEGELGINLAEFEPEEVASVKHVSGTGANDALYAERGKYLDDRGMEQIGNYVASEIHGGEGKDYIAGSYGADRLYGDGGNDWITAESIHFIIPEDPLPSTRGDDYIDGGEGDDVITGRAWSGAEWHGGDGKDMLLANVHMNIGETQADINNDNKSDDIVRWSDLLNHLISGFKIYEELQGDINLYTMSAWAGVEPGTYTGNSALGNGWTYEFVFTDPEPLHDPAETKGSGISLYSYIKAAKNSEFNYSNPNVNDGEKLFLPSSLQLLHVPLPQGVTAESIVNTTYSYLFGDKGDDLLVGWYGRDELYGGEDNDALYGEQGNDLLDGGVGNDTIIGGDGADILLGGDGNDVLIEDHMSTGGGNDLMLGGKGDDNLNGWQGNDYLEGGAGADTLLGGDGDDILVGDVEDRGWGGGQDNDIYIIENLVFTNSELEAAANASPVQNANILPNITPTAAQNNEPANTISLFDDNGNNTLAIAGATLLEQISLTAQGQDLILRVGDGEIFIVNGLNNTINQIVFGDSAETLISQAQIGSINTNAVAMDDVIAARLTNDIARTAQTAGSMLVGGLGNDTLTAHAGGSTFLGSKGNDALIGNSGDDVYVIRANDGRDTITESGGNNKIKFAEGIAPEQIILRRSNGNLLVLVASGESITVNGMFNTTTGAVIANNAIQSIEFANKTQWDLTRILQETEKGITSIGTDYVDVLTAYESNDTLIGGKGNDKLQGDKGDDHYHFALNHGADIVTDLNGHDHIHLADGISEAHVSLRKDTNNNLIIRINNTDSITVTAMFDAQGALTTGAIEEIHFGNTGVWNAERIASELARNQAHVFIGTDSNDVLMGDNANQTFMGHEGDDQLNGGAANDTYQYALGDGKDVIQDVNGIDRLQLTGITESGVLARRVGADLQLTINTSDSITIKNAFDVKAANVVAPGIVGIIEQLQNRWLSQAEALIETHYGLTGSGNMLLEFEMDAVGGHAAHVETIYTQGVNTSTSVKLVIDLADFTGLPNGDGYLYYDRIIAHEMVHAVMSRNMNTSVLPGWFNEGVAEFIHGADERVAADLGIIGIQHNFNVLFKTTVGSPGIGAGYSVSYIAVRLLDKEIRDQGGLGIKEVFDQLKAGKTLDQALTTVSAAHGGMSGVWNNLASFESHFLTVGFSLYPTLLNLSDTDTGSIAGSDYGNASLSAESVLPEISTGPTKNFSLVIPEQYISSPEMNGALESIGFDSGAEWDLARITQEVLKPTSGNDTIHAFDTNDILSGAKGNDQLIGYAGDDIYRYDLGDGADVIIDSAGTDMIEFGANILATEIYLSRNTLNNLDIRLKNGYSIIVKDAFDTSGNFTANAIESIKFSDQVIWDAARIKAEIADAPGVVINGSDAYETLVGDAGSDTISGAKGNDRLMGGKGNDTYRYALGDGHDVIDDAHGFNKIDFGAGISWKDMNIQRDMSNNLIFFFADGGTLTFNGAFDASGGLKSYLLSSTIYFNGVADFSLPNRLGTSFDDTLVGSDQVDTIVGAKGDDQLLGGKGGDSYEYTSGDGHDVITDIAGADKVVLNAGIYESQVAATRDAANNLVLSFVDGGSITVSNAFDATGNFTASAIENIYFVGSRSWWNSSKIKEETIKNSNLVINGTVGNDTLNGNGGNDIITGGENDDSLLGGLGDDIYVFGKNDGVDRISDLGGKDAIHFSDGILPSDVLVDIEGGQLRFRVTSGTTLYTDSRLSGNYAIESVVFSNGTVWSVTDLKKMLSPEPTNDDDNLFSFYGDVISGGGGNDTITSLEGYDTLLGGEGDDYFIGSYDSVMVGGSGNDKYWRGTISYNRGDGNDTLERGHPVFINFGPDISPEDISIREIGGAHATSHDIRLQLDTGESIYLEDLLGGTRSIFENIKIQFASGEIWNKEQFIAKAHEGTDNDDFIDGFQGGKILNGKGGNDTLYGYTWEQVMIGGQGNDYLSGMSGVDTYIFGRGDGQDSIDTYNYSGLHKDRVEFIDDITSGDISITRIQKNLIISVNSGEIISVENIFDLQGAINTDYSFEKIVFSDGEAWVFDKIIEEVSKSLLKDTTSPNRPSGVLDPAGHVMTGAAEPGSTIIVSNDSGSEIARGYASTATGTYGVSLPIELINGEKITVTAIDASGNFSDPLYVIAPDKTPPAQPTAAFDSTGYVISGFAEAGSVVDVKSSDNQIIVGSSIGDSFAGSYSVVLTTALINKELVNVTSTDASGNISVIRSTTAPDKTAPLMPTASFDATGKVITGFAEAGSTVIVKNASGTQLKTATANATTGAYTITLTTALINKETVNVTAKDVSGNISEIKAIIAPDKTAPAVPTASFDATGKIITGIAEAGSTVIVKNAGGTQLKTATAGVNGNYSITLNTALINKETVNVTAKDAAGNISAIKAIIAPDKTAPNIPTASFDTAGKVITGVAEAGSTVSVTNAGGTVLKTAVANATTGAYTITLTTALINKETVNVTAKDTAGNISAIRAIIAPDKTAPTIPTASFDPTGKIITGVAEAGSTVSIKNAAGTELKTAIANATTGAYTITLTTALINKETVNVTAKDAAGNISAIKTIVAPDKTAPLAPTASIDTSRKIITGTAEPGSVVEVKNTAGTKLGQFTAHATTGAYTITLGTALAINQTVNVTAKDAAGNVSPIRPVVAPATANKMLATPQFATNLGIFETVAAYASEKASLAAFGNHTETVITSATSDSFAATLPNNIDRYISGKVDINALIQAMASFEPAVGVDIRNRIVSVDQHQVILATSS